MSEILDVIIIGAGPAGLCAAIYAKRAELDTLLIEKSYVAGGQILSTYEIDNYPGYKGISGMELATKFSEHADSLGIKRTEAEVESMELEGPVKKVITDAGTFLAKTVIIATGSSPKLINVKGEEELTGMGVSYCATCDGAFFKGRTVAVIGGGDVAVEDGIFLARGCKKVYLIHRRDELRAAKVLVNNLLSLDNAEVIWNSIPLEIIGEDQVEAIRIKNLLDDTNRDVQVDGVFIAVGSSPNLPFVKGTATRESLIEGKLLLDEKGYIVAGEDCSTNIPGVYAAGDVRSKRLRQVTTAIADGANAVYSVEQFLTK